MQRDLPDMPGRAKGTHENAVMGKRGVELIWGRDRLYPRFLAGSDIANVALFLVGNAAAGINGAETIFDEGTSAF